MLCNYITCVRAYVFKIACFFVFCGRNVIISYDFGAFCDSFGSFGFFFLYYFCEFFRSFGHNGLDIFNDDFFSLCLLCGFFCRSCSGFGGRCRCFLCCGSFLCGSYRSGSFLCCGSIDYGNYLVCYCFLCGSCGHLSCFLGNGVCTLCLRSGDNLAFDNLCIGFADALKESLRCCNKISCDNEH